MELDELLKLIRAVSDSELTGFKYEAEGVCLNLKKEKEVVTAVQTLPAAGVSQSVMPMQTAAASAMSVASADSEGKAAGTKTGRAGRLSCEITAGGDILCRTC